MKIGCCQSYDPQGPLNGFILLGIPKKSKIMEYGVDLKVIKDDDKNRYRGKRVYQILACKKVSARNIQKRDLSTKNIQNRYLFQGLTAMMHTIVWHKASQNTIFM